MTNRFDEEKIKYLNENIDKIEKFEFESNYYLRIYFIGGEYMEIEPEYGAIYLDLKS